MLADGEFYRVGGHTPLTRDVRVIAATHQDLEERVRQGLFREDLLHRLNVVRLRLPPLRERGEDIPPLARHFLQKSARELAVEPKTLTDAALHALSRFAFPGNVRQLENICHWLTVMAPGQRIDVADLPPEVRDGEPGDAEHAEPRWEHALDRELPARLRMFGVTGFAIADLRRQVLGVDQLAGRHHREPVADVLELAHVAGEIEGRAAARSAASVMRLGSTPSSRALLLQEVAREQRRCPRARSRSAGSRRRITLRRWNRSSRNDALAARAARGPGASPRSRARWP